MTKSDLIDGLSAKEKLANENTSLIANLILYGFNDTLRKKVVKHHVKMELVN